MAREVAVRGGPGTNLKSVKGMDGGLVAAIAVVVLFAAGDFDAKVNLRSKEDLSAGPSCNSTASDLAGDRKAVLRNERFLVVLSDRCGT